MPKFARPVLQHRTGLRRYAVSPPFERSIDGKSMPDAASKPVTSVRAQRDLKRIRTYLEQTNVPAAAAAAEATSQRFPALPAVWYWRAVIEQIESRHVSSIAHVQRAIALDSEQVEFFAVLARSQLARGDTHLAVASAMRAVALNPAELSVLDALAEVLHHGGIYEQALLLIERALPLISEQTPARAKVPLLLSHALVLQALGRDADAQRAFEALLTVQPTHGQAHWNLAQYRREQRSLQHLQQLEQLTATIPEHHHDQGWIEYARYIEYEDRGDDLAAINALLRGASLQRRQIQFDTDSNARVFARMKQLLVEWERTTDRVHAAASIDASPIPIFIVGMPRSGTGLVQAMLGQHEGVQYAGESREFAVCLQRVLGIETAIFLDESIASRLEDIDWAGVGTLYRKRLRERFGESGMVIEKLPANYIYAAAIARALPEARLLRMVREPMDNCFSLYRQMYAGVNPFSFDQIEMAQHYIAYEDWMRQVAAALPDRLLNVRYEQLVGAPALVGRALFRFCGLSWQDEFAALGPTRLMQAQFAATLVTGPLHGRFVGRWRRYEAALEPMQRVLSSAGLGPRAPT
jgi:tetratricopeptide (TPR) repeat protein